MPIYYLWDIIPGNREMRGRSAESIIAINIFHTSASLTMSLSDRWHQTWCDIIIIPNHPVAIRFIIVNVLGNGPHHFAHDSYSFEASIPTQLTWKDKIIFLLNMDWHNKYSMYYRGQLVGILFITCMTSCVIPNRCDAFVVTDVGHIWIVSVPWHAGTHRLIS